MLTTESMRAILSSLLEQQTHNWKINAKRNVLLECWLFYTQAKCL